MQITKRWQCLNALHLKFLAMVLMVCAHLWSTIIAGHNWLDAIGRLAFPIFAFQIVEGFFHTKDFKKYLKRMFLFALISELPFNLMAEGGWICPFHQNVMFTFCIALLLMRWMEKVRTVSKWRFALRILVSVIFGFLLGFVTMVDYFGYGILMVLGIVGFVAWCLPIIGFPVTIVGLVLGIVAINKGTKGMAVAGVIMCAITLVITLIILC